MADYLPSPSVAGALWAVGPGVRAEYPKTLQRYLDTATAAAGARIRRTQRFGVSDGVVAVAVDARAR